MTVVSMRNLLEHGVHFGHQTRRWNPKFRPYIYTSKNGIYIIDLAKTQEAMDKAYESLRQLSADGKKVLFVGTKKQAQATILAEALRSGSFYVNQRWLGGTLTNFKTIQKSIKKLTDIEEMETSGTINVYPKKEQAALLKKKDRLNNFLGGIKEMKKLPDALFVVDPIEEHNAVAEARKLHIPVYALIDTNADPNTVDFPIPANDDAVRSIQLMVGLVADAIAEGKGGQEGAEDISGALEFAHQDTEGEDISMKDVMVEVDRQAAEYEKRRRQRFEERRQQMQQARGGRFNGANGERRVFRRNSYNRTASGTGAAGTAAPAPAAAPKAEEESK